MPTPQALHYKKKIATDKEFHDKECKRINEYIKQKYTNDPEYRELRNKRMREYYHKKKLLNSATE